MSRSSSAGPPSAARRAIVLFGLNTLKYLGRASLALASLLAGAAICLSTQTEAVKLVGWNRFSIELSLLGAAAVSFGGAKLLTREYRRRTLLEPRDQVSLEFTAAETQRQIDAINARLKSLRQRFAPEQIAIATQHVLALWKSTERVTETVELGDTRITRHVHRQLALTTTPAVRRRSAGAWRRTKQVKELYVPVLRHRKQVLLDEIDVEVDGEQASTMSHADCVVLTIAVARNVFEEAFPGTPALADGLFRRLVAHISHPAPTSNTRDFDGLRNALRTRSVRADKRGLQHLLRFVDYLCDYYFIYVPVPADKEIVAIRTTYSELRHGARRGYSNRVRRWFGIPVYRYRIPVPEVLSAPTYHLRSRAPDGTYLNHALFREKLAGLRPVDETARFAGSEVRFAASYGTDTVHLYCRGLERIGLDDSALDRHVVADGLYADIEFQVTPPGLSLPIVALSVYLFAIITTVAFTESSLFIAGESAAGRSALTVILALPALLTAWIASRVDRNGLRLASPIALLELGILVTVSVLAVGTAVFAANSSASKLGSHRSQGATTTWSSGIHLIGPAGHLAWGVIWLLSATQLVASCGIALARISRYGQALRRSSAEQRLA